MMTGGPGVMQGAWVRLAGDAVGMGPEERVREGPIA
jgi:hypothetical protein